MPERQIDLKNPWLAGVLALLVPGAGHFYQGRMFKAVLYSACILGTFAYGMHLGDGKVVFYRNDGTYRSWGYYAQVWVGLPAWPAFVQSLRATDPEEALQGRLDEPIDADFEGFLIEGSTATAQLTGRLVLSPVGQSVEGEFRGTLVAEGRAPEQVELPVAGRVLLERKVLPGMHRDLDVGDLEGPANDRRLVSGIHGRVPRSLFDRFEAPPSDRHLQDLHRDLGKFFDLACVFTWVAGLLNILAVWDALEGPAYGYGDESESTDGKTSSEPATDARSNLTSASHPETTAAATADASPPSSDEAAA